MQQVDQGAGRLKRRRARIQKPKAENYYTIKVRVEKAFGQEIAQMAETAGMSQSLLVGDFLRERRSELKEVSVAAGEKG